MNKIRLRVPGIDFRHDNQAPRPDFTLLVSDSSWIK